MSDLSNITQFSGITITSDQTNGTNNPNATFAVSNVTTAQRDLLQNVTPYQINGNTVTVKNGTLVYNITSGVLQIFINGLWENLFSVNTAATGAGLTSGTPFVYPSGPRGNVEVDANQVNGFTYFDVTNTVLRTYKNAWQTITSANAIEEVSVSGIAGTITLTTDQDNPSIILKTAVTAVNTATTTIQGAGTNTPVKYIFPATPAQTRGQKLAVTAVENGVIYLGWLT